VIGDLNPYPSYMDSDLPWAPRVPRHWHLAPNRTLMRRRKVLVGERHSDFQLLSLTKLGVIVRDVESGKGKFSTDMGTSQEVRAGDLVFCLFDVPETPRTVGLSRNDGMITGAYTIFECFGTALPAFVDLFYRAMDDRKLLSPLYSGLRNTIPASRLLGVKTPVPPIPEQLTIVRFLEYADQRIRRCIVAKQKLIKLLEEQKQITVEAALTNRDEENSRRWQPTRLKYVATIQTGVTLGKTYGSQSLLEYPYLRVANVQAGRLSLSEITTVRVPEAEANSTTLQDGDVLMTEGGDIDKLGRGCVWRGEIKNCLHQNHIFAVRPRKSALLAEYLVTLLASSHGRRYFEMTAKKTTNLASTNSTTLGNFPMLLPDVKEQHRILARITAETSALEVARDRTQREIDLLREYRTCLIAEVVTGKLDVRQAAEQLPDETEEPEELTLADEVLEDGEGLELASGELAEEEVVS
jgi:type I restriction enzyme, S subunit